MRVNSKVYDPIEQAFNLVEIVGQRALVQIIPADTQRCRDYQMKIGDKIHQNQIVKQEECCQFFQ